MTPANKKESAKKNRANIMDNNSMQETEDFDLTRKDMATVSIIHGLNFLINKANSLGIHSVAKTLTSSKEDLVYWAVNMNYHETLEEKFINKYLYDSTLQNAKDLEAHMMSA